MGRAGPHRSPDKPGPLPPFKLIYMKQNKTPKSEKYFELVFNKRFTSLFLRKFIS
jgi:hypothetical protein